MPEMSDGGSSSLTFASPGKPVKSSSKSHLIKPGVTGNPGGRPKRRPISDRYAEFANRPLSEEDKIKYGLPEGGTYGDALAVVTFKAALEGEAEAVREIREAIEGKTAQRAEASDNGDLRISVIHVGEDCSPKTDDDSLDGSLSGETAG